MAALTDEQRRILDTMAALNANADSVIGWIEQLGAQEAVIADLSTKLAQEINAGTAPARTVRRVLVEYDDDTYAALTPAA